MGLNLRVEGCDVEYENGYITFMQFRLALASKYDKEFGDIYKECMLYTGGTPITERRIKIGERWNEICNDDLDIFLNHSDCDGKMTPSECRKVYNVIKDWEMDFTYHNYPDVNIRFNMLENLKVMLKYSFEKRRILRFS